MDILSGKVVGGKIVLDGPPLAEGSVVTVLARSRDETFVLGIAAQERLLEAIAEVRRGETVDGAKLLRDIKRPA